MLQKCEMITVTNPTRPLAEIEKSLTTTYRKDIFRPFVKAINEFNLVEPGDKIAIGISGGKDSLILAKLFQELKSIIRFHLNWFSYQWIQDLMILIENY